MKYSKSHKIYRSDTYPNLLELLFKSQFWIYEWIIFYLISITLIAVIYFLNSEHWTYTFLSMVFALTIVSSVLVIREIKKTQFYKELLLSLEKDELYNKELFKKIVDDLGGESEEEGKLRRTKERLERIQATTKKTWKYSFESHLISNLNPTFYSPYSSYHNPYIEKSEEEIILILLSLDKHKREEILALTQSLEKKNRR